MGFVLWSVVLCLSTRWPLTNDRGRNRIAHQIPRHPHESSRTEHGSFVRSANPERTYYIVPAGMSVIFRDEFGNELKR